MTLRDFFAEHCRAALAFSGGVDSAYLLYAGLAHGCDIRAYFVKSEFQPRFELEDALRLARELGAQLRIIELRVLPVAKIRANDALRCYYCKQQVFSAIARQAREDGYPLLLDGTNASDDAADRPGMKALEELSVRSPLRECGLTKDKIRRLSREAGLFTWDKPSYACLATRIASGTEITAKDLEITETAEGILAGMGFRDFRIRKSGGTAKLQLREAQLPLLMERRNEIMDKLKPYYDAVTLDLEARE